ncbi:MAG: hypothetical protein FWG50_03550 [Kiritimatiellaeota bacterium]|nr:hypothetical protein [Kiritimatiellota bacterium]
MKIHNGRVVAGFVCVLATAVPAFAQLEDGAEEADPVVVEQVAGQGAGKEEKGFDLLVRATTVRGEVEVMNPDVGTFGPVQKGRAYPLGSVFRTGASGYAVLSFSTTERVELLENTEVVVLAAENDPKARSVRLVSGRLNTGLKDTLLEGQFSVETPNASCKNMAGRAKFSLTMTEEIEELEVATVTGVIRVEGSQYTIEALRAANTVNVQTSPGRSLSRLTSESGDYRITLENGTDEPVVYDMSPKAVVKIWRETAAVGGRMVVSTLVVRPTGTAAHRFAYAVGRDNIQTGELVPPDTVDDTIMVDLLKTDDKPKKPVKPAAGAADAEGEEEF